MYLKLLNPIIRLVLFLCLALLASAPASAQNQSLEITKTAAETNVSPGDLIHYLLEPSLKKGNKATDVVITDPVPAATSFVSATGGGVHDVNSNTVTWTFPEFNQGGNPSFELILQVDDSTSATEVVNTVTIEGNGNDGDPIPGDQDSVTVQIQSAPFIVMTKTPNAEFAAPGVQVTYTIAYQNTGNADAVNAVLSDPLPPFTNYVDSTLGGVYNAGTNTVTWPPDGLAAGASGELLLILEMDAAAPDGTLVQNTATMRGDNFADASATGNVTIQSAPLLALSKSADTTVTAPNDDITYQLDFSNQGNATATGVILKDNLPQDTSFVSATGGGQFDGTKVVWNLSDLEPSQTGSVTMKVRVRGSISPDDDIQIFNSATLSSLNAPPVTAEITLPVILQAILEMTKTANSDFIDAGKQVFYTLRYENIGTATAENVVLSDRIPAGTSFVSATGGATVVDGEVIWTDPGLVPGAVGQVQLVLRLDDLLVDGSDIINTASIESDTSLPVAASSTITVNVAPSLKIVKTSQARFAQPGQELTYNLRYTNRGNADATNVSIEDLVPQGTSFVSASGGGTFANGKVTWLFPKLGIGQTGNVFLTVLVGTVTDDDTIYNNVTLDSDNAPATSAAHNIPVQQSAFLRLRKQTSHQFVNAGQDVTFTLTYENGGNATANNVVIEDFLPSSTTFIAATGGGAYDAVENKVVWTDPGLSAGALGQVQLTLRVDLATPEDTVITNSATVTSDNTSPVTASDTFIVKSSPDLRLTKKSDVKTSDRGEQITYTLKFQNDGNTTSVDTLLEDLLPENTEFVSASGGGVLQGNSVSWSLDNLDAGEEGSVSLTVVVSASAPDGAVINNVATLDSSNAFAVSATNTVIVDLLPALGLSKTSPSKVVEAGQQVTFTLSYENTGNAAATNIELTDEIPADTSFVSATGGGNLVGNTVTWTDPSLDVGALGQVQLTLKIDENTLDKTVIINNATMNSTETPPVSDTALVTVTRTPLLQLENTASVELAAPGDEITFTLDVANVGNATATVLVLEDAIPAFTSFVSVTGGGVLNNGVVTWTGDELAVGVPSSVALTVRVNDIVDNGVLINNTATFDAANTYAVSASSSVTVQSRPILTLTKTASSDFVEAGAQTSFILEFENTGSAEAIKVILQDELPDRTTFVGATSGGSYDPASGLVSWNFTSVQVGEIAQVTLTIGVDVGLADGTTIHNTATIDSDETQPVTANDSVIVRRTPVLDLSKTSNVEFIGPGESLTYILDYTNTGNDNAFNAVLEDPIPANTSYVSSTGGGVLADGKVTWNITELAIGATGSVSLTVLVDPTVLVEDIKNLQDGTIIRNTATLDSPDAYAVSAEDEVTVKFSPRLELTKTADRNFANPGDTVTYILDFTNIGNVNATGLILEDTLPDHSSFVSASDGGIENAGIVSWTHTSLPVGESGSVSVVISLDSPLDNGTIIHNSASLSSDQTPPVGADNTLFVISTPLLVLSKTADKTNAIPGDEITYTLTAKNQGDANASNGILQDVLPGNTTFVAASNGGILNGTTVTWSLPVILVGEPQTRSLTVRVNSPLDNGTPIYNTATLSADTGTPVSADHLLNVESSPRLTLDKKVDQTVVTPGQQLVYTLTYGNAGNANASSALLEDGLPARTTFVAASDGGTLSNGIIQWNLGDLPVGTSNSVTLTVEVISPQTNGTRIDNTASLNATEAEPVTAKAVTIVSSSPVLNIETTPDRIVVDAGQQVVYKLDYGNSGNADATGVFLLNWLPDNTRFINASDGGVEAGGVVTWPITSLTAGIRGAVTLTVEVDSPLDNATVLYDLSSLGSSETTSVSSDAHVIVQSAPILQLTKTASVAVAQPDDQVTYTLELGNTGNANAHNATLTDVVPVNMTFVSATGPYVQNAGVVTWTFAELLTGDTPSVTMTVKVNSPVSDGTVVTNTATLAANLASSVDASADVTINSAPVLTLTKTASATVLKAGDLLTYTLSVGNTGNENATNPVLKDTVPLNTTFVSATGPFVESGGIVTWTVAELPVGIGGAVTMTVQVNSPLADGTFIINTGSLSSDQTTPVDSTVEVMVESTPVLSLVKTADQTVVQPGDLLTYTLSLSNNGNENATTVVLKDVLPANTSFVSASGGGTETGGVVTWTAPELPVGIPAAVTLTVQIDSPLDNGTAIINNASLSSDQAGPVDAALSLNVQSAPVLSLTKTADKTNIVNPGDTITYTLTLGNSGNANATGVVLKDTLPANITFVSASNGGTEAGGVVTWTTPELLVGVNGSVTLTVLVNTPLDDATSIYNSASLTSDQTEPVTADHNLTVQSLPVLGLTKIADKTVVNPGDQITYTLSFGNTGNENATGIVLEDTLPDHTVFVDATGDYTLSGDVVTWTTPELLVGISGSVTLTVEVGSPLDNGTPIYNSATLSSDQTVPVSADNNIAVQSAPVMTLVKTADKTVVNPGDTITYTLSFSNDGDANATGVVLVDTLPANTTFVSAPGGVESGGFVTWTQATMVAGSSGSVVLTVLVNSPLDNATSINNSATLSNDQTPPVSASHSLAVQSAPLLTLTKTTGATVVKPGDQVTYALTLGNTGNANASNIVLQDTLPADSSFVSATGGGTESGGVVTWNIAALLAGVPQSVTLTVLIDSPLDNGTLIYNSATMESDQAGPVSADHSLTVQSAPALTLEKAVDKAVVIPGDQLTYTLNYANNGDANSTTTLLLDTVPANTTFVSASDGGTISAGVVSWDLGTLTAGSSDSVTLTVMVATPLDNNTIVSNTASLESDQSAPVSASVTSSVQSAPVLTLSKDADKSVVDAGQQLVYTLSYANTGNANATAVSLIDSLPVNTSFVAASGGGTELNGEVTWPIGVITAGTNGSVTLTVVVDSPLDNATLLTNSATLNSSESSPVAAIKLVVVQSSPILSLTKTASVSVAQPGDQITYTMTLGNSGNANAPNAALKDVVPANTSFVSASGGGVETAGIVTWRFPLLLAGDTPSVTMTVQVNSPLNDGTVITNTATLDSDLSSPIDDSVDVIIESAPVLSLDKSASASVIQAGDLLTYTLAVGNTGNENATNPVLKDTVPLNTTFVSATGPFVESGGIVTWTVAELPVGIDGAVTMTVQVNSPLADGTFIINTGSLSSDQTTPVESTVEVMVESTPVLSLVKTADQTVVQPGDLLTYTLSLSNSGNENATTVVLKDVLPVNTTFVSASGGGTETGGVVTWTAPELPVGIPAAVTLTVQINSPLDDGTAIINNASLASDQTSPVTATHTLNVQSAPVLSLTKTADKTSIVNPGDTVTYTLTLGNSGNANATGVVLKDTIPVNTSFVSASNGGTPNGNVVSWNAPELLVGVSGSVTLTVLVDTPLDNGTTIYNSASLSSDQTSPVTAEHSLAVQSLPVLSLTKIADKTVVNPGDQITYTLSFGNTGNENATGIVLEDTLPDHTVFIDATGDYTLSGDVVTWTTPELLVGISGSVTLTVEVDSPLDDGTPIYNSATLSSDQTVPVSADDTLAVQSAPVLALEKIADKDVVNPGETITYTLSFANNGNANAVDVVLEDLIPANTTFVSAPGGVESGGIVTWTLGGLVAGSSGSVTLTVQVDTPLDNGTTIFNSATLSDNRELPVTASNEVPVQSAPVLTLTKTTGTTVVNPGDQVTYTLTLGNTGNANASNIVLQDTLPADSSFVSATGGGTESGGIVTWNIAALLAGEPQTVTLTVLIDSPLDNGTLIYNSATMESDQAGPVSADHSLTVQSAPALTLEKAVDKAVVIPGEQLTYTLNYANNGDANSTTTLLLDTVPANTTFVSASDGGSLLNGIVSWDLGTVGAGSGGSRTLTVMVVTPLDNNTIISNTASLESDQSAPVSANATSSVQSAPVLSLTKTPDKSVVDAGQQLIYTLDYDNTGNANATSVVLIDSLPTNTSFVAASNGGTESNGIVTWSIGTINAGTSGSVTLTVAIDSPLDNATLLTNPAVLNSAEAPPVAAIALAVVQSAPILTLDKTASVTVAQPGDLITYTMTLGNNGNANAPNAVLTDAVPANTSFVSASGNGTESNGIVSWTFPLLLAGDTPSVTMTVQMDSPLNDGTVIGNTASLVSNLSSPINASVDVTIKSSPVLSLIKSASASVVKAGDLLTYTLTVGNTGNENATSVVLEDTVPANTTFVSATGPYTESGGVVTWTTAELPVGIDGAVTLTVRVDSPLNNGTVIDNTASLSSDQTTPVSDSVSVTVESTPVLNLNKVADQTVVQPGDLLTYTLSLGNSGNENATTVVLTDVVPANASFVSASGGGTEAAGVVTWTAAELPVGVPAAVTLTVQIDSPLNNGTAIINNASLSSDQAGPVTATHTLHVQSAPVLSLQKAADKAIAIPGNEITYTLSFGNSGNANASTIVLQDTVPAHTSFVSASGGGVETAGIVTWTGNTLLAGESGSVTLTVRVDTPLNNGTAIYNSASLSSMQTAPVSASHSLAVQSAPVLTLAKTADATVVNPGEQITYTLSFSNTGNENASSILLEDTLPDHTTFVAASHDGSVNGNTVSWNAPELLVGISGSVTLTVKVDTPLDNGTPIYNSATLSSDQTVPVSADNNIAVQSAAVLTLVKTADKTVVNPGERITYTLTASNIGNENATGILLEDTLPAHTSFVSASGGGMESGGIVTWTSSGLLAGDITSVTLTVLVDTPLVNGTTIYNSASLNSEQTLPVSADNALPVQSSPVIHLVKTANKTIASPGEQITYLLEFGNNGNANSSNIVLQDELPENTSFVSASDGGVESTGIVTWNTPVLLAGDSGSVTLTVLVDTPLDNGTIIYNSATLDSDQTAPVSASQSMPIQSAPLLTLEKLSDKKIVSPGGTITYSINYANDGNTNATSALLKDNLPAHTSFVSATGGGTETNGKVSWAIGDLPVNTMGSVSLVVMVDSPLANATPIYNVASLGSTQTSPVTADNILFVQSAPLIVISMTGNARVVSPGETITYLIDYGNTGNENATGLTLQDTLPDNTTFVSASDGGTESNGIVTWQLGALPVTGSGQVVLIVKVDSPLDNATVIYNTATAGADSGSPASDGWIAFVQNLPVLSLTKTADKLTAIPGDLVTYTLTYSNSNDSIARDVVLEDRIPANTTFDSASAGGVLNNGKVIWQLGSVAPGETDFATLTVRVDTGLPNGTLIVNIAEIDSEKTTPATAIHELPVINQPYAIPTLGTAGLGITALLLALLGMFRFRFKGSRQVT